MTLQLFSSEQRSMAMTDLGGMGAGGPQDGMTLQLFSSEQLSMAMTDLGWI